MKTGTLIVARLGSQRLPRKHLLPLGDARAIDQLIRRVRGVAPVTVLCTTTLEGDDALANAAQENGIAVFRGSAENVPARLLLAAREHGLDFVAVVEGDEAFVDRDALETMLAEYTKYDYVVTEGFPIGAHILGMRTSTLETICGATGLDEQNTDGWGRYLTETGWFRGAELRPSAEELQRPDYRLTLDYPEDYELLRAVYQRLYQPDAAIALADVLALLDRDVALRELNGQRIGHYATHMKSYPPLKPRAEASHVE